MLIASASASLLAPPAALGQVANPTYTISKAFTVVPNKVGMVPTVTAQHFEHASARDPAGGAIVGVGQVDPNTQAAAYTNIGGYEGFSTAANGITDYRKVKNGTVLPNAKGVFSTVPPLPKLTDIVVKNELTGGAAFNQTYTASVGPADGIKYSAMANARFNIAALNAATNSITGTFTADGTRDKVPAGSPAGSETYAFSYAGVNYTGTAVNGMKLAVTANPTFVVGRQSVSPPPFKEVTHVTDPVSLVATDASGNTLVSAVAQDLHAGVVNNAYESWTFSPADMLNHVHLEADGTGELYLAFSLNAALVGSSNAGSYLLDVVDQSVTQSSATGVFASLPTFNIGSFFTSTDFTVGSLSYNLTLPDLTQTYSLELDESGFSDIAVPEPTAIVMLSIGIASVGCVRWLTGCLRENGSSGERGRDNQAETGVRSPLAVPKAHALPCQSGSPPGSLSGSGCKGRARAPSFLRKAAYPGAGAS